MKQRRASLRELVNDDDKKIVDEFANYWDQYIDIMARLVTKSEDDMAMNSKTSDQNYSMTRSMILSIAGMGLLAGIAIALFISISVSGALQRLLSSLEDIA